MKTEFLGSTIGLSCNGHGMFRKLIRVEFYLVLKNGVAGKVKLQPVSGHTLGKAVGATFVPLSEFEDRPNDPSDRVNEARWALNKCGWTLMHDDYKAAMRGDGMERIASA